MKSTRSSAFLWLAGPVGLGLLLAGCVSTAPTPQQERKMASFVKVRPVLERSCVHCHAAGRIPGMPSLTSTRALAALTGPGNLIVPGFPERSRFFQVVTLSNRQTGAMPPTGHALSKPDVAALRTWILEGAPVPDQRLDLTPKGMVPRSI